MARKKVVTTREEVEGPDAEIKVAPEAPSSEGGSDDALEQLLSGDDGGEIVYKVYLHPAKAGDRLAYCAAYGKGELNFDTIRDTFGGGTYKITGFDSKGKYVVSKNVAIVGLPKSTAAAQQAAPAASAGMEVLLLQLIKSQGDMVTALLSKERDAPAASPSAMELVALIKALQPEKGASDPVDLLLRGLEMGRGLGGGGTDFMDLAKTGLESLAPLIKRQAETPAPTITPRPAARLAAVPTPTQPQPATAEQPKEGANMELPVLQKLKWLQATTTGLVVQASRGKDPELYAEVFLDNLPPFITLDEVAERFKAPEAVAQLAQINPAVANYAAWFESFRVAVNSFIEDDDEDTGTPPGPTSEEINPNNFDEAP
jgi:hypothetical protein